MWALRYRGPNSTSWDPKVQALLRKSQTGSSPSFDIAYQGFGAGITSTVGIDAGGQLLGYSPDGEHIRYRNNSIRPVLARQPLVRSRCHGPQRRLIYTTDGRLQTAAFSPNNKYVLATTSKEQPDQAEEQSAVISRRRTAACPRGLCCNRSTSPAAKSLPLVDARFLTEGAFAGRMLVVGWQSRDKHRMYVLTRPIQTKHC